MVTIQTRGTTADPKRIRRPAGKTQIFFLFISTWQYPWRWGDGVFFFPDESMNLPKELTWMFFPFTIIGFHTFPGRSGDEKSLNSNPPCLVCFPSQRRWRSPHLIRTAEPPPSCSSTGSMNLRICIFVQGPDGFVVGRWISGFCWGGNLLVYFMPG